MKFARFMYQGKETYGLVEDDKVTLITGNIYDNYQIGMHKINLNEIKLLAPCSPSKIICVGLNYRDHAKEMNLAISEEPVLFMKPATAVIGPDADIVYPAMSSEVDYEAELAIVIGKEAKNIKMGETSEYIFGYTCANDITARDLQRKDGQWTRAKCFDTFLPLGPYVVNDINPDELKIELYLNGQCQQSSNTNQLIFNCDYLVSFISQILTLHPGDVIITGTPSGIGSVQPGDRVKVVVENVGMLENTVVKAS